MRRAILLALTTLSLLVLLLGFKATGGRQLSAPAAAIATTPDPTTTLSPPLTSGSTTAAPTASAAPSASTSQTLTGTSVATRYGNLQVSITLSGGKITAVTMLQAPSGEGRSAQITRTSIPILTDEALNANSAQIDSVSGATYTSAGYVQSLQSALDQARG